MKDLELRVAETKPRSFVDIYVLVASTQPLLHWGSLQLQETKKGGVYLLENNWGPCRGALRMQGSR